MVSVIQLIYKDKHMFKKKTVFIIGAGASAELGLPVGQKLKSIIGKKTNIYYDFSHRTKGDALIDQAVRYFLEGRDHRDPNPYYSAGRQIAASMPLALSIDNYLHTHNENEQLIFVGKLGIALSILEAESDSFLAKNVDRNRTLDFGKLPESWHTTFVKMLTEDVNLKDVENIFKNVSIITFNYDRCIEHYLNQALANYFGINLAKAQEITQKLTIIHPYGQVGLLPWQGGNVKFGETPHARTLVEVANQIKTFTEHTEDEELNDEIFSMLAASQNVVFLGFSFGAMNMKLLQVAKKRKITGRRNIYGSAFGLSEPNKSVALNDICRCFGILKHHVARKDITLENNKCNEFLIDHYSPLLRL